MIIKLISVFICILGYKILKNVVNFRRIKKLYSYFLTITTDKVDGRIYETKAEVISLFKLAGIKDGFIPVVQPAGYNFVAEMKLSLFNSYPSKKEIFYPHYLRMFDFAFGVFKYRIFEAINPIFWIDTVVFAPKAILNYLGMEPETRSFKLLNLILTGFYWLWLLFWGILSERFKTFIFSYLP